MKKVPYFSHDYGARNDPKLEELQMKLGYEGIGLYWSLVELLYEQQGYLFIDKCEIYAFGMRTHSDILKSVIRDFDLFKNDGVKFWSQTILIRLELKDCKTKSARKSAMARWGNDANALQTHSERNAFTSEKKGNKGKEIKEVKEKLNNVSQTAKKLPKPDADKIARELFTTWTDKFFQSWKTWIEYKYTQHRFSYKSETGIKKVLKNLSELAGSKENEAIRHIDYAIAHDWKGFYPITQNGHTKEPEHEVYIPGKKPEYNN